MKAVETPQAATVLRDYEAAKTEAWDDLDALGRAEESVDLFLRDLGPVYDARRELRVRIAELRGPAELPKPRWQTDTQRKVAACPRCGERPAPVAA